MKWSQKPLALVAFALFTPLLVAATPAPLVHHYPVEGTNMLVLFLDGGNLHLIPQPDSAGDFVTVSSTINNVTKAPLVANSVSGKHLNITISGAPGTALPFAEQGSVAYEVRFPSRLRLQVVDQSGDVTVDESQSPVAIDDDSGNVFIHQAHARVDAVSDNGDASVDLAPGWDANAIRMESSRGDIHLTLSSQIHGEIDATSEDGTVHNTAGNMIAKAKLPVIFLITEKGDVCNAAIAEALKALGL